MSKKARDLQQNLITASKAVGSIASYPALPLVQNDQKFYFATIPVDDIFPFCFVARREEDPSTGFQRALGKERAEDIAAYLDNSKGSIPTNIVLSAQDDADLEYISRSKILKYSRKPKAFLVLDGQHRIFGYGLTKKPHRVPVAIYHGLSRKEEVALFIDINTTQRGVPAALLLDIKHLAERESAIESQKRALFDKLQSDSSSPLNGLLSPAKSATGYISRVTFNKGIGHVLDNSIMAKLSEESQYTLIRNYLSAIEQSIQNKKLLARSAYFEAFCDIFDEVTRQSRDKFQNYKLASLLDVLAPIGSIALETVPTGGKTLITKNSIVLVLKNVLAGQIQANDDMV